MRRRHLFFLFFLRERTTRPRGIGKVTAEGDTSIHQFALDGEIGAVGSRLWRFGRRGASFLRRSLSHEPTTDPVHVSALETSEICVSAPAGWQSITLLTDWFES